MESKYNFYLCLTCHRHRHHALLIPAGAPVHRPLLHRVLLAVQLIQLVPRDLWTRVLLERQWLLMPQFVLKVLLDLLLP